VNDNARIWDYWGKTQTDDEIKIRTDDEINFGLIDWGALLEALAELMAERQRYGLEFSGIYCRKETSWDQGSDSDEPYAIFSSLTPYGTPWTVRSNVYDNVDDGIDSGDNWGPLPYPLYVYGNGGPDVAQEYGCLVQFMEHDQGDPNAYKDQVDLVVKAAAAAVTAASGVPIPDAVANAVAALVNDLLGTGDDQLGLNQCELDAGAWEFYANQPLTEWQPAPGYGISRYHFWVNCDNGDSNYYAFFTVKKM
jgi:hypothetical protein